MRGRSITALALLASTALLAAGCGGGDDSASSEGSAKSSELSEQPTAKRPVAAELAGFNAAIAARSCERLKPYYFSIIRQHPPGSKAGADECSGPDSFSDFAYLSGLPFSRNREYGTAALIERPGDARNGFAVWALDSDGRFRFTGVAGPSGQIGTPAPNRAEAERVALQFLRAVGSRDCAAVGKLLSPTARLIAAQAGKKAACKSLFEGQFLAPALRQTPSPRVEMLGGTRNLAVVGVPTEPAYFTMLLVVGPGGPNVLDVLPNTSLSDGSSE